MSGEPMFVVYDGSQFDRDPYDDEHVNIYPTPETALVAVALNNEKFNGYMPGPGRTLVRAYPWKAYEMVEVTDGRTGQAGTGRQPGADVAGS